MFNCLQYNERKIGKLIKQENTILGNAEYHYRGQASSVWGLVAADGAVRHQHHTRELRMPRKPPHRNPPHAYGPGALLGVWAHHS